MMDLTTNEINFNINKVKEENMSALKNWLIEHDEAIGDAIERGATSVQDVISYCAANMQMIDPKYITEQWNEFIMDPRDMVDSMTKTQIEDLDNSHLSEQEHNFGDTIQVLVSTLIDTNQTTPYRKGEKMYNFEDIMSEIQEVQSTNNELLERVAFLSELVEKLLLTRSSYEMRNPKQEAK